MGKRKCAVHRDSSSPDANARNTTLLLYTKCLAHLVTLKKKKSGCWNLHLSKVATDGRVFENVGSTYKTHQINDGRPSEYNHFFINWRMYSECIRRWFWMYSGCIRVYSGVFGCIPALPLRYEQTTHLKLFIYIPNVSKALAIKGQKDGRWKKNGKPGWADPFKILNGETEMCGTQGLFF